MNKLRAACLRRSEAGITAHEPPPEWRPSHAPGEQQPESGVIAEQKIGGGDHPKATITEQPEDQIDFADSLSKHTAI